MKNSCSFCTAGICLLFILCIHFNGSAQTRDVLDQIRNKDQQITSDVQKKVTQNQQFKLKRNQNVQDYIQENKPDFEKLNISTSSLEQLVNQESFQQLSLKKQQKSIDSILLATMMSHNIDSLIELLLLKRTDIPKNSILDRLEIIQYYPTADQVYDRFQEYISQLNPATNQVFIYGLKENLNLVGRHLNDLLDSKYVLYRNVPLARQKIKGVNIYLDNDFFLPVLNEDMNYTGGGRIEVTTDYFKMRWLTQLWNNDNDILAYQGIYGGVEAYTPYIRYTDSAERALNYANDRPFGSYEYFGRAKYRMLNRGHIRSRSDVRIGRIGGKKGNFVQSVLHRDQTYKSIKVIGWEDQIASGGRFAWNVDHNVDFLLFSPEGDIFYDPNKYYSNATKQEKKSRRRNALNWLNIYGSTELHFGNFLTAAGAGLGISRLNFLERSGGHDIRTNGKYGFNFVLDINYRYIIHNSMLEGFGFIKTFPDDPYDDEPISAYQLKSNEVERHLVYGNLILEWRINKTTVFYSLTLNSREYKKPLAKDVYGWGSIGFNFML